MPAPQEVCERTRFFASGSMSLYLLQAIYMSYPASSVKPRVMTPQSSVKFPKTHLKRAKNSGKQHKKRVMRAVFALYWWTWDEFT